LRFNGGGLLRAPENVESSHQKNNTYYDQKADERLFWLSTQVGWNGCILMLMCDVDIDIIIVKKVFCLATIATVKMITD